MPKIEEMSRDELISAIRKTKEIIHFSESDYVKRDYTKHLNRLRKQLQKRGESSN